MVILVDQSGLTELRAVLAEEEVAFEERPCGPVTHAQAVLPEVQVPREYTRENKSTRAFRLPSGRLLITDSEGNLELITRPKPRKAQIC